MAGRHMGGRPELDAIDQSCRRDREGACDQRVHPRRVNMDSDEKKEWDPRTLTSLPQIFSCLSALQSEEAELSNSLTKLLSAREPIVASLNRLNAVLPHIEELHHEAVVLFGRVSSTAQTAERIGGRVSTLDEEMRRIKEAGERVAQVMQLKVRLPHTQPSQILNHPRTPWQRCRRPSMRKTGSPLRDTARAQCPFPCPSSQAHLPRLQLSVQLSIRMRSLVD